MQAGRRKAARLALVVCGVMFGSFALFDATGLRLCTSASLPIGLYKVTREKSTLVEFCPAEPFAHIASERGYRDAGSCADRRAPLLKPVVALPGDQVTFSASGLAVNGAFLANTAALPLDSHGRGLTAWAAGTYRVRPGELVVASSYSVKSFDSRYFGPIRTASVRERLEPLLVWK